MFMLRIFRKWQKGLIILNKIFEHDITGSKSKILTEEDEDFCGKKNVRKSTRLVFHIFLGVCVVLLIF